MNYQEDKKKKIKRGDTPLAPTPVVRWENNIKNPANRLNVNEVYNNRDTPVDAPKETLFRKMFPKKVSQGEYNKFWDVKADSIPSKK
jgi:hypothetical protein